MIVVSVVSDVVVVVVVSVVVGVVVGVVLIDFPKVPEKIIDTGTFFFGCA